MYGTNVDGLPMDLGVLHHRGPDGRHTQQLENSALGHTRLAIVDIETGDQPFSNAQGTIWMVCNGEIYNHRDIRAQFPDYPFKTLSDNEVILPLYERYGVDAIRHLDGMFAFALVDTERGLFYMGRDPIGIKPLYYGWRGDTFVFGSEIKMIQDQVDTVQEMLPGHWYSNQHGTQQYFDLKILGSEAVTRSKEDAPTLDDIRQTFIRAVQKRLMSDVPLGVYLSGGLDSTIVASVVAQEVPNVHSFAVGVEGSIDLQNARAAAQSLGTQHHETIYTLEDMLEALPEVIYHLESFDPSLVRSAIPNYFLARTTREYVTVVLTGEGADELYAGYHYLKEYDEDTLHDELIALTGTL
ncbi:MAG: asparagine synthase (glutamine-hydrolyzing), partial [Anaerolineae bacterium]|nr:asparagine synthase (glutamine-hydrolyzing) [Anaerolineae bacterium]